MKTQHQRRFRLQLAAADRGLPSGPQGVRGWLLALRQTTTGLGVATILLIWGSFMLLSDAERIALTAFAIFVIGFGAVRQKRLASAMAALEHSTRTLEQTNFRFNAALENMAHGLCMFDADHRLIVCNRRYGEMYGLTPQQTEPGTTLRSIIEARIAAGRCPEDAESYIAASTERAARHESSSAVDKLRNGQIVAINHTPMAGGGWVAVHQDITQQHLAEERLDEVRGELIAQRSAIDQAVIVAITDVKGRITYANDVFCRISGYSREELIGRDHRILNSGSHPPGFFADMYDQIARGKIWRGELCNRSKHGLLYWVDTTIVPQLGPDGRPVRYMAIRIDISARKNAEAALRESQNEVLKKSSQLELALANISQGLCMFDAEQRVVVCNEQYARIYGLSRDDTKPGTTLGEILQRRVENGIYPGDFAEDYHWSLLASVTKPTHDVVHLNDGRAIAIAREPIPGGGWVTTHQDITGRQRVEAEVLYLASHDVLTGLANRAALHEKMEKAVARLQRGGNPFAVVVLDLDRFKLVNDSLGHPVGDQLLKTVAGRLLACTGEADIVTRLGGDEFAILTTGDSDLQTDAIALAERLLDAVALPYDVDGHKIVIGTSIGIAIAPSHGCDVDQVIRNADLALYKAKSRGRNTYCLFEASMATEAEARHSLEIDLRDALIQDEFEMHYHPIVDIATRELVSVESLIRWRHPQRGLIAPDAFIPLAEDTGLINPVGEWALRRACSDALRWPARVKVAVNLSPLQFQGGGLVEIVARALADSGLPPERLELEITESVLMDGSAENLDALHRLRRQGIAIVLDDFGTGYSSLSYLRLFPFDRIKIDRSFVKELAVNADCTAIVSAVAGLGRGLHIGTVAEGVETEDQLTLARAAGCTQAQGFLFGKPRPLSEFDVERAGWYRAGAAA